MKTSPLTHHDPAIAYVIEQEKKRQQQELNLIASENYVSPAVREATGSILTNKYAEGYPHKRYYGGCQFIDEIETIALDRCKKLFNAEHANVQPHAGSQANMAAYAALLKPGDLIMGMSLAAGGHLTHGHNVNFSGTLYRTIQYTVNRDTEELDYEALEELAHQHKPQLIIAGASAYSRIIDFERFATIARSVGAFFMADMAHIAGLVAAQLHPSPVPHADCVTSTTHKTLRGPRGGFVLTKKAHQEAIDRAIMPGLQGGPLMHVIAAKAVGFHEALDPAFISYQKQIIANAKTMARLFQQLDYRLVAGGTDNHLFIIDLRSKNMNGKIAETALQKAGISISRSCIPFDPEKPWITSGIRIGTPAVTTRGMKETEMELIVQAIHDALTHHSDDQKLEKIKAHVHTLCAQFPLI